MKFYKLHINDNGHRIGFTFTEFEDFRLRLDRLFKTAASMQKVIKEKKDSTTGDEYLVELVF